MTLNNNYQGENGRCQINRQRISLRDFLRVKAATSAVKDGHDET
jgi:hypothetical protein